MSEIRLPLHTHKLGVADKKFMKQCFEKGLIENAYGNCVESGKEVPLGHIHTTIGLNNKIIEEDKYITITVLSTYFRNFTREIIYIIDSSFNKIDNL